MRITINPIMVDETTCSEVEVSVAASSTVAIRAVPVDAEGVEHPSGVIGIVGDANQSDIAEFLTQISTAVEKLFGGRGF